VQCKEEEAGVLAGTSTRLSYRARNKEVDILKARMGLENGSVQRTSKLSPVLLFLSLPIVVSIVVY
jgi:hypothetical protein